MEKINFSCSLRRVLRRAAAAVTAFAAAVVMLPSAGLHTDAYTLYEGDFEYAINASSGKVEATIVRYVPQTVDPITGNPKTPSDAVPIPQTIGGYTVTAIAPSAFVGATTIKTVTMPATVTSIGQSCFQNCSSLQTVSLPQGLTEISDYTFKGCTALKTVNVPATVKKIGYDAFRDCITLDTAPLNAGLESIGSYAFKGCTALKTVKMPDSVTVIGTGCFEECIALQDLTLSKGLTNIEDFSFYNCRSLKSVIIPEGVTRIGRFAFSGCVSTDGITGLTSIELPKTVTTIAASAFEGCRVLSLAILPNSVTSIADSAFNNTHAEIYGYAGSYAQIFANRMGLGFHSYGAVYNVTFSVDTYAATVNNVSIVSKSGLIIPPSTVIDGEQLVIRVSPPEGYELIIMTVNGEEFPNGGTYTVNGHDVEIFASFRREQAPVTTQEPPATSTTTSLPQVTTVTATQSQTTTTFNDDPEDEDNGDDEDNDDDDSVNDETTIDVTVESNLEDVSGVKVRMRTDWHYFIDSGVIRVMNTQDSFNAASAAAESLGSEKYLFYSFDITPYDLSGNENTGLMARGEATFQIPVPNRLLPYTDNIRVYHIVDGRPEPVASSIIEDVSGTKRVQFTVYSFSPYMFFVETDEIVPIISDDEEGDDSSSGNGAVIADDDSGSGSGGGSVVEERPTPPVPQNYDYSGNANPHTGIYIAAGIPVITLICVFAIKKQKRKRAKTSTD